LEKWVGPKLGFIKPKSSPTETLEKMAQPKPSPSPAQQKHWKKWVSPKLGFVKPKACPAETLVKWVSSFIHTLENIILFSEVDKHRRNECPPEWRGF